MKTKTKSIDKNSLKLDPEREINRIVDFLYQAVFHKLHRQGAVVGISGGIDSSVVLALSALAFGPERVIGLIMPERDSSPESALLAKQLADGLGVEAITEDIRSALEGSGCYERRDAAIRRIFPEYGPGWSAKLVLPGSLLDERTLNIFRLAISGPDGQQLTRRLPLQEYSQLVAASNLKQRTRMSTLYYYAELHNYAVIGTANKNEHALGFFVKYGDGGVDASPIAHLYKTQVYQLAACLKIPKEIQERTPTTDTYPGGSTQEEFFFRLPFDLLDIIWHAYEQGLSAEDVAASLDLTSEQVRRVYTDISIKQRTTEYLRSQPLTLEDPSL